MYVCMHACTRADGGMHRRRYRCVHTMRTPFAPKYTCRIYAYSTSTPLHTTLCLSDTSSQGSNGRSRTGVFTVYIYIYVILGTSSCLHTCIYIYICIYTHTQFSIHVSNSIPDFYPSHLLGRDVGHFLNDIPVVLIGAGKERGWWAGVWVWIWG